jgi:hypothetical protein
LPTRVPTQPSGDWRSEDPGDRESGPVGLWDERDQTAVPEVDHLRVLVVANQQRCQAIEEGQVTDQGDGAILGLIAQPLGYRSDRVVRGEPVPCLGRRAERIREDVRGLLCSQLPAVQDAVDGDAGRLCALSHSSNGRPAILGERSTGVVLLGHRDSVLHQVQVHVIPFDGTSA